MRRVVLLFVVLVLFTGIMSFTGCSSTPKIHANYMVPYDPQNPIEGTWYRKTVGMLGGKMKMRDEITVIKNGEATVYWAETQLIFFQNMRKRQGPDAINKERYILSDNDNTLKRMDKDGNIMETYQRIKK